MGSQRRLSVPIRLTTTHHCVDSNNSSHPIIIFLFSLFFVLTPIFLLVLASSHFSLLEGFLSLQLTISELLILGEHQDNAILPTPIFILVFFPFSLENAVLNHKYVSKTNHSLTSMYHKSHHYEQTIGTCHIVTDFSEVTEFSSFLSRLFF